MNYKEHCTSFLSQHNLLASQYNTEEILSHFIIEMENGLSGKESCLKMIPSYIPVPDKAPVDEKIIVLDAGGTNFRTALIRFDHNSTAHIDYFTNNPMPGIDKELSRQEFFNQIVDYIQPVVHESNRLGFCFSYPAQIDSNRDGTLLIWTKEIKAPEVVGQKILANIARSLKSRNLSVPANMLVLNDTVASLLAGITATKFSTDYNYSGFILGTGTNTAYIESNKAITKVSALGEGRQVINVESANFNKMKRGDIDLALDSSTINPGEYVLEKMVSGAYLGTLCSAIMQAAASEKLISEHTGKKLQKLAAIGTPFISVILTDGLRKEPEFKNCSDDEAAIIKTLISETVERAAKLTAINMAAPIVKTASSGKAGKYCISVDGSVFYKLYSFRERAEKYLAEILKKHGCEYKIVKIEDAPLIGTAVAGLVS